MEKVNIILAIEFGEIFTADFISMAILIICMCFPVVLIIWWGFNNYYSTGHIFPEVDKNCNANDDKKSEFAEIRAMPLNIIEMEINHLELVNCDSFGKEQLQKNEYYQALKKQKGLLTKQHKIDSKADFPSPDPTLDNK